jgi:hypothetical protein
VARAPALGVLFTWLIDWLMALSNDPENVFAPAQPPIDFVERWSCERASFAPMAKTLQA